MNITAKALTKRSILVGLALIASFLAFATVTWANSGTNQDALATGLESVVVDPTKVHFVLGDSRSTVTLTIHGAGFGPGVEVGLLLRDTHGVLTDITPKTSEFPLFANDDGAWGVQWTLDRFTRNSTGGGAGLGDFSLWVVDRDLSKLAAAPIAMCDVNADPSPPECGG